MKYSDLQRFANSQEDLQGTIDKLPNSSGFTSGNMANIMNWIYVASGIIAVGVIVYGGIKYTISQGDPGKTKQASQILAYGIVGLLVILIAAAITNFVIASGVSA